MNQEYIDVTTYDGEGYKPMIDYESWRVAILKYCEELEVANLKTMQKHNETDEVFVITGDRDILQCINQNVEIWLTKKGFNIYNRYTLDRFTDEYGLQPKQLIDVKAFMGDTADGYPGVKGIGEKTAIKLIQQHGSVENVINAIDQLTVGQRNKIENDMDNLKISKSLAAIHTEVPLNLQQLLTDMQFGTTLTNALNICHQHELHVSQKYLATHFK